MLIIRSGGNFTQVMGEYIYVESLILSSCSRYVEKYSFKLIINKNEVDVVINYYVSRISMQINGSLKK